jgi:hypothetical protein
MQFIGEADWNYTVTAWNERCIIFQLGHMINKVMGCMTKISMGHKTSISAMGLMTSADIIMVPNGLHGIIFKSQNKVGKWDVIHGASGGIAVAMMIVCGRTRTRVIQTMDSS